MFILKINQGSLKNNYSFPKIVRAGEKVDKSNSVKKSFDLVNHKHLSFLLCNWKKYKAVVLKHSERS